MLRPGDTVVLNRYSAGYKTGTEFVVIEAKLKSDYVTCQHGDTVVTLRRAVVVRIPAPRPNPVKATMAQSLEDLVARNHPNEHLMTRGVQTEVIKKK